MKALQVLVVALAWVSVQFGYVQGQHTAPHVHDPVMAKHGDTYYLFATGRGIAVWSSTDLKHWKREAPVFATSPAWTAHAVPGFKGHFWAPDISYHAGQYYLYYSVSEFGENTSCIGLATNVTLDPADPRFRWIDRGKIIQSYAGMTDWNAIDPNIVEDANGSAYLSFGSFWEGLKLVPLSEDRLRIMGDTVHIPTIASRDADPNPIEAPFIFKKDGYYYLFASIDYCCKGLESTYKMIVGRAREVFGPYVDDRGVALAQGGGRLVLAGDSRWHGVGHNSVYTFDGVDYLVFHGYDGTDNGISKLRIERLNWDEEGWPRVMSSAHQSDADENKMAAYLMVYFKDDTHSLYMALSADGYTFTDVNGGRPVTGGDTIAMQRGTRDPHITRGPDGQFYLAMTDLHIFAQKQGFRDTEWERDGAAFGWGNNRGLVLMRSGDLINWSRTNLRIDTAFPGWEGIGCVWAPELIYDKAKGKLMVYFTLRFGNGLNRVYYAYLNDDFTALETEPRLLFQYPKHNKSYIDGDITKVGDKYHLFYVAHDGTPGIKQAVSDSINTGYVYDPTWYDPEPKACEAPNVWKRIGEEKWVLMYDIYGIQPHNFGFSETSDFINFTNLGHFNDGVMKATNFMSPKHGAVIHLTRKEAATLAKHWGLAMEF